MNAIIQDKAYDETKIYLRSIFFEKCMTDELKQTITELYNTLTVDNSYEVKKQAQDLLTGVLSELRRIEFEKRLIENRLEDQVIFQWFVGFLMLLVFISFMLSRSIFDINFKPSKSFDSMMIFFLGLTIVIAILFIIYCIYFNFMYHWL